MCFSCKVQLPSVEPTFVQQEKQEEEEEEEEEKQEEEEQQRGKFT